MQPLVCGRFLDKYIAVNRHNNAGVNLREDDFAELWRVCGDNQEPPDWFGDLMKSLGCAGTVPNRVADLMLVRSPDHLGFGRASYELTERCNYRCQHCYLGDKMSKDVLSLADHKQILDRIAEAGCMWLQITGGEPLLLDDFAEIYRYAYGLGLLVTISTNGSLLTRPKVMAVLGQYAPYRLDISLYGATPASYEALTRAPGSFSKFREGLAVVRQLGLRTRLSIITTRYNEHEIPAMQQLAEEFGSKHHVYLTISPTLAGDGATRQVAASCSENLETERLTANVRTGYADCRAGRTFFHVNSQGQASVCKVARDPSVDLLRGGLTSLTGGLAQIADNLLRQPPECRWCARRNQCTTCPPMLALYQQSGEVPASVCSKSTKEVQAVERQ